LHAGIPFFVFCCVVTKELLQKEDPLNQNIQLFSIDFCFGDFTNNPESRVGNLSWSTSDSDLHAMFSQYGQVTSAHVIEDRETGRSRGFGFVEMDEEGARKSIQALNGTDCQGRSLKVNEAQPRESRSRY